MARVWAGLAAALLLVMPATGYGAGAVGAGAAGTGEIRLQIGSHLAEQNGAAFTLDLPPQIVDGRTLVPLRFLAEALGASLQWESQEQRITVSAGPRTIVLWAGRREALVGSLVYKLDVAPLVVNGHTLVPLRFLTEHLGARVEWNEADQSLLIARGVQPAAPRPGWLTGTATDERGAPLAGVTVTATAPGAAPGQTTYTTETDRQGQFALALPDGFYTVTARVSVAYHGEQYRFALHPPGGDDGSYHPSRPGIVRNYVWQLSGRSAGAAAPATAAPSDSGGTLYLLGQDPQDARRLLQLPAGASVEVRLTPVGPLVDGSPGQLLTWRQQFSQQTLNAHPLRDRTWPDIPPGQYTAVARLLAPDGTVRPLYVAAGATAELAAVALLRFPPRQTVSPGPGVPAGGVEPVTLYLLDTAPNEAGE